MSQRLEEIKARLARATPGPWEARHDRYEAKRGWTDVVGGDRNVVSVQSYTRHSAGESDVHCGVWISDENAALIAHAPADLAYLLAEVERLRADAARWQYVRPLLAIDSDVDDADYATRCYTWVHVKDEDIPVPDSWAGYESVDAAIDAALVALSTTETR